MDTNDAKATLSNLEDHLAAAMRAKIEACGHISKYDNLGTKEVGLGCVVEVASDRSAMLEALTEYGYRMFLEGERPFKHLTNLAVEADVKVSAKILNAIKAKQEVRGV